MRMDSPITAEKIHGIFAFADAELDAKQEEALAGQLDYIVRRDVGGSAVWFTENDRLVARARGQVLMVNDRTVGYRSPNETLMFPNYQSPTLYRDASDGYTGGLSPETA